MDSIRPGWGIMIKLVGGVHGDSYAQVFVVPTFFLYLSEMALLIVDQWQRDHICKY